MKKISEVFARFLRAIQPASRARFRELMKSHCPRTKEDFMKESKSDSVASSIAEKLYHELLNTWCPLEKNEFVPHLLDDVAEDYGIVNEDLENLILDLLVDYALPKKGIKGSDKEIITVRDLIEFAIAVTRNYPLKSEVSNSKSNSKSQTN